MNVPHLCYVCLSHAASADHAAVDADDLRSS